MKPKTLLVGGLALFLGFTFLPIGINNGDVIDGYYATTSYASAVSRSQSAMVAPYVVTGKMTEEDSSGIKQVVDTMASGDKISDYLFLLTPRSDPYNFDLATPATTREAHSLTELRSSSSGWHGGCDVVTVEKTGDKVVWNCALFSGTVVRCAYETGSGARGRQVTVESDACPGLFFRYCHMAPGQSGNYDSYSKNETASSTTAGGSLLVKVGDHVDKGEPLGIMGNTGASKGTHAHFDLFIDIDMNTRELRPYTGSTNWYTNWRTSVTELFENNKSFKGLNWYLYPGSLKKPGTPVALDDIAILQKMGDMGNGDPSFAEGDAGN